MDDRDLGDEPKLELCETCHNEQDWRQCYECGGTGFSSHDCGEDSCNCLYPEDNVPCDTCQGAGGWLQCRNCLPWED